MATEPSERTPGQNGLLAPETDPPGLYHDPMTHRTLLSHPVPVLLQRHLHGLFYRNQSGLFCRPLPGLFHRNAPGFRSCLQLCLILLLAALPAMAGGVTGTPEYLPGKIIVKLEDEGTFLKQLEETGTAGKQNGTDTVAGTGTGSGPDAGPAAILAGHLESHSVTSMQPVFRQGASDGVVRMKRAGSQADRLQELSNGFERTFFIRYSDGTDPVELSGEIRKLPGVVYAEPHFVHETTQEFRPDDPLIGAEGHDYFAYQNFFRAWAVSQGSSDVVISIVDSGVYYDHPDLTDKLWRNPEPGRADQYFPWTIQNDTIGWNFWESGDVFAGEPPVQNGNPVGNFSTHGTHVAGIAAADTDNGIGMAGTGFNAIFMPVKTGGTREYPRSIAYGYQGILYAAINEADIINCSFGGTNFSEFGRDVVEFATASGSLVVAAAGNNGSDVQFYPAAFDDVLTVGSVRRQYDDVISHFSNYGYYVDVFAMGEGLLSTYFDYFADQNQWVPNYRSNTGTSMAAPVVSGLAALIKAANPDWSPQRIASQIRTNARSLYGANPGTIYENRLGMGLIDAHAALVNLNPGLRITDFAFEKSDGRKINVGERGKLTLEVVNYGERTSASTLRLEAMQDDIRIGTATRNTGAINTGQNITISFDIDISRSYRLTEIPLFRVEFSEAASDYSDFYMLEYEQLLFDIVDINTITTSFSSDGTIGYLDALSAYGGVGFLPGDYGNVLFEGGLMISAEADVDFLVNPASVVVNQVREKDQINRHFLPLENYRFRATPTVSDLDGYAVFKSTEHPIARDLQVEMETFAFDRPGLDKAIIVVYNVINSSMDTYRDMYVGLFNDWDIRDAGNNRTGFVAEDSLIYAFAPGGGPYVTSAHLGAVASAFAIDNASPLSLRDARSREDSLRFGIYYRPDQANLDGFTEAEKRLSLTAGTERTTISNTDISLVTSSGPFTLHPYARIRTGFVYAWGENVTELRNQVAAARQRDFGISPPGEYMHAQEIADRATIYQNFPNPFNTSTIIEFHLGEPGPAEVSVYDILGRRVATIFDGVTEGRTQFVIFDAGQMSSGVYIAVLRAEGRTDTMPMTLVR